MLLFTLKNNNYIIKLNKINCNYIKQIIITKSNFNIIILLLLLVIKSNCNFINYIVKLNIQYNY